MYITSFPSKPYSCITFLFRNIVTRHSHRSTEIIPGASLALSLFSGGVMAMFLDVYVFILHYPQFLQGNKLKHIDFANVFVLFSRRLSQGYNIAPYISIKDTY